MTPEYQRQWKKEHPGYQRKWRQNNPEKYKRIQSNQRSRHRRKIKHQLIEFLGGKCRGCGLVDYEILVFDHKNNDGRKEKRGLGYTKVLEYYSNHVKEAKRKLMLLCHNCNWRKEMILRELKRLQGIGIPPF